MWRDDHDLTAELAAAGSAAREGHGGDARPDPAFAAGLRQRLAGEVGPVRTGWSLDDVFGGRRLAPLLAAGLLLVAVGAAARTVLIGGDPAPAPTPVATPAVIVGIPDGEVVSATPSPTSTATPSPSTTASPMATAEPTPVMTVKPVATAKPQPKPEPTPTPVPVPTPIPTPTMGSMALQLTGCNGGPVLEWSMVSDARFHHYATLRSTSSSIPAAYPPQGGAVEVGGSFTKDPYATSAVDPSAPTGTTLFYRTLAFDAENRVIAASPVASTVAKPIKGLGSLSAETSGETTTFTWTPYGGLPACFSYYKLVFSETNPAPSYLAGDPVWAAIGEQGTTSVATDGPASGTSYFVRLQAVRATATGKMVVAQTEVLVYLAP